MSAFKRCTKCGETKPLDEFYKMAGMRDGHRNDCKACNLAAKEARYRANPALYIARAKKWQSENRERYSARQREWRERNPEKKRQIDRDGHLRRKFGITQADYDRMLEAQGFGCGICGDIRPGGKTFHVDHDHRTGAVRGLLCVKCNEGIALLRENPTLLRLAAEYLDAGEPVLLELVEQTGAARRRVEDLNVSG